MPPKAVAEFAAGTPYLEDVDLRDVGKVSVGGPYNAGAAGVVPRAEVNGLLGTFAPARLIAVITLLRQMVFSWRRGATAGELPYVARSRAVDAGKPLQQGVMEALGFSFTAGQEYIHPSGVVSLGNLAKCPLGVAILEKAVRAGVTISEEQIGALLVALCAVFRVLGAFEDIGDVFSRRYRSQKDSLASGSGSRGYSKQLSFWLGAYTVKAAAVEGRLAAALLSITTLTDLLVLAFFETPQAVPAIVNAAPEDILGMARVLMKRETLEHEKLARVVLDSGAYHQEERPALNKMRTMGLSSLAIPEFTPPSPPGIAASTFVAELKERVAFITQERSEFRRTRGEDAEKTLIKMFPQLEDTEKGF